MKDKEEGIRLKRFYEIIFPDEELELIERCGDDTKQRS